MNIEDVKIDWGYIYDFLMKYNPKCSKTGFVETMEEMQEKIIFKSKEDLELAKEEYEKNKIEL